MTTKSGTKNTIKDDLLIEAEQIISKINFKIAPESFDRAITWLREYQLWQEVEETGWPQPHVEGFQDWEQLTKDLGEEE